MNNKYEIHGDITSIFLTRSDGSELETIIETDDLERANSYNGTWYSWWDKSSKSFYALGNIRTEGKRNTIRLHRYLMNAPKGMCVDHINHNSLDNRRNNLRIVTNAENQQNRKGAKSNSVTGIRGVHWSKKYQRYIPQLRINGKVMFFGNHKTIEEAERAVEEARKKYMKYSS